MLFQSSSLNVLHQVSQQSPVKKDSPRHSIVRIAMPASIKYLTPQDRFKRTFTFKEVNKSQEEDGSEDDELVES
jgi:hypothetical protein